MAAPSETHVDPLLDPAGLQDNGGPTQTIKLQPNSPAIDADPLANCPSTDQRGAKRPELADFGKPVPACDSGAVESGGIVPTATRHADANSGPNSDDRRHRECHPDRDSDSDCNFD